MRSMYSDQVAEATKELIDAVTSYCNEVSSIVYRSEKASTQTLEEGIDLAKENEILRLKLKQFSGGFGCEKKKYDSPVCLKKGSVPFLVLSTLAFHQHEMSSHEISRHTLQKRSSVGNALSKLEQKGYCDRVSRGIYRVNKQGLDKIKELTT